MIGGRGRSAQFSQVEPGREGELMIKDLTGHVTPQRDNVAEIEGFARASLLAGSAKSRGTHRVALAAAEAMVESRFPHGRRESV